VKKNIGNVLKRLFNDVCDVIELREVVDEAGITNFEEVVVLRDIPCRICYNNLKSAVKGKASDYVTQDVTLLLEKDVFIRDGSIIRVLKNGSDEVFYQKTGEGALFDSHREIRMVLKNTFA